MVTSATLPGVEWECDYSSPLILLSLQPQYWQLVLEGRKKYEYRRSFRSDAVQAYIYLSSPRKEVGGFISFGVPIIDTPHNIAEFAEVQTPGSRQSMVDYMDGRERGFAIPILSYEEIPPIPLSELVEQFGFTAPQNYLLLDRYPKLRDFIRTRHYDKIMR